MLIHTCWYMHVNTCASLHTHIHTHIRTYIHACTHTYIYTDIHAYLHTYIRTYIHTMFYTHVSTCMPRCISEHVFDSPKWEHIDILSKRSGREAGTSLIDHADTHPKSLSCIQKWPWSLWPHGSFWPICGMIGVQAGLANGLAFMALIFIAAGDALAECSSSSSSGK